MTITFHKFQKIHTSLTSHQTASGASIGDLIVCTHFIFRKSHERTSPNAEQKFLLSQNWAFFYSKWNMRVNTKWQRVPLIDNDGQPWWTPLLRNLHWLRSPQHIDYKLAVLVFRCLNGLAPRSLRPHSTRCRVQRTLPPFVVIIVVSGPTNTACHCRRPCFSGRTKSCLEQFATRRHISFDSRFFCESASKHFCSHVHSLLNFNTSVHRSGLEVFFIVGHSK